MDYKVFNQELVDYLMDLNKFFEDNKITPATIGERKAFSLSSTDKRCSFYLDMNRTSKFEHRINLQTRYSTNNEWLVRVDINCPPHINFDGSVTERDHVHIRLNKDGMLLNMGYNLNEFDELLFKNAKNVNILFRDFCKYCNIELTEEYQEVL